MSKIRNGMSKQNGMSKEMEWNEQARTGMSKQNGMSKIKARA